MRIHFWTADQAGSAYYRGVCGGQSLAWIGHTVSVGEALPADWETLDVLVGCRVARQNPSRAWAKAKELGIRLVLDLDDDYFHIDPTNQPAYTHWQEWLPQLEENVRLADRVTVCSKNLAAILSAYNDDVRVVENGLPAQFLAVERVYDKTMVTVGGAFTTGTAPELKLAMKHFNWLGDYKPGLVEVLFVGMTPQDAVRAGVKNLRISVTGWIPEMKNYLSAVHHLDVWVAPYRDTPFNQAKFPTKALEAGFLGVPLIASDVGAYGDWITHGENGFLVPPGDEKSFRKYMVQLADDPELRQYMGLKARARASRNILQGLGHVWQEALS